ncbi:MAG: hypothetical protein ACMG6E_06235 [Candidatus Roizmanbacteria bacterium]
METGFNQEVLTGSVEFVESRKDKLSAQRQNEEAEDGIVEEKKESKKLKKKVAAKSTAPSKEKQVAKTP